MFEEGAPKSFNLDLSDLSREVWSLLPQPGDFVAEVRTRRFDELTYARSGGEAEDVTVFSRGRKRNISAYASEQKLQSRGRFFDEDDLVDYDVLDYDIDAAFYPEREWMEGRTRMRVRVKSHMMGVLTLRFAETLNVSSVVSDEFGRLLFLRVRNQNSVLVNLPQPVARDFPLTLTIAYAGRLERQRIQDESVAIAGAGLSTAAINNETPNPTISPSSRGAEVALQQSQLLVSAEPGHRLRHRAHSSDGAVRVSRGLVGHSRRRLADRRAVRRRRGFVARHSARRLRVHHAAAGALSRRAGRQDVARGCGHRGARHRRSSRRTRPTCAARRRCSSKSPASRR